MDRPDDLGQIPTHDYSFIRDSAERLEKAWEQVADPRSADVDLAEFLPAQGSPLRVPTLYELVKTDMALRGQKGLPVDLTKYLEKYHDLGPLDQVTPQLIFEEYLINKQNGVKKPLSSYSALYSRQFPELEKLVQEDEKPKTKGADAPNFLLGLAPGMLICGRFQHICRIGNGAFGEVHRVLDTKENKDKALKLITRPVDSREAKKELEALKILEGLQHPHLLQTEGVLVEQDRLIIVMELADCSLAECRKKRQQQGEAGIPIPDLIGYLLGAAEALDYLHRQGIIHRDIKPENILLKNDQAKVADFGLAKAMLNRHSTTASNAGTPGYMPPEVLREERSTAQSDLFSLAVTYFNLREGTLLFSKWKDLLDYSYGRMEVPVKLQSLPRDERKILRQAIHQDPEKRFNSCKEFMEALNRVVVRAIPAPHRSEVVSPKRATISSQTLNFRPQEGPGTLLPEAPPGVNDPQMTENPQSTDSSFRPTGAPPWHEHQGDTLKPGEMVAGNTRRKDKTTADVKLIPTLLPRKKSTEENTTLPIPWSPAKPPRPKHGVLKASALLVALAVVLLGVLCGSAKQNLQGEVEELLKKNEYRQAFQSIDDGGLLTLPFRGDMREEVLQAWTAWARKDRDFAGLIEVRKSANQISQQFSDHPDILKIQEEVLDKLKSDLVKTRTFPDAERRAAEMFARLPGDPKALAIGQAVLADITWADVEARLTKKTGPDIKEAAAHLQKRKSALAATDVENLHLEIAAAKTAHWHKLLRETKEKKNDVALVEQTLAELKSWADDPDFTIQKDLHDLQVFLAIPKTEGEWEKALGNAGKSLEEGKYFAALEVLRHLDQKNLESNQKDKFKKLLPDAFGGLCYLSEQRAFNIEELLALRGTLQLGLVPNGKDLFQGAMTRHIEHGVLKWAGDESAWKERLLECQNADLTNPVVKACLMECRLVLGKEEITLDKLDLPKNKKFHAYVKYIRARLDSELRKSELRKTGRSMVFIAENAAEVWQERKDPAIRVLLDTAAALKSGQLYNSSEDADLAFKCLDKAKELQGKALPLDQRLELALAYAYKSDANPQETEKRIKELNSDWNPVTLDKKYYTLRLIHASFRELLALAKTGKAFQEDKNEHFRFAQSLLPMALSLAETQKDSKERRARWFATQGWLIAKFGKTWTNWNPELAQKKAEEAYENAIKLDNLADYQLLKLLLSLPQEKAAIGWEALEEKIETVMNQKDSFRENPGLNGLLAYVLLNRGLGERKFKDRKTHLDKADGVSKKAMGEKNEDRPFILIDRSMICRELGRVHLIQGKDQKMWEKFFEEALSSAKEAKWQSATGFAHPGYDQDMAWITLGHAFEETKSYKEAIVEYKKGGKHSHALLGIARTKCRWAMTAPKDQDSLFNEARLGLEKGNWVEPFASSEAHYWLGQVFEAQARFEGHANVLDGTGNGNRAHEAFKKAIDKDTVPWSIVACLDDSVLALEEASMLLGDKKGQPSEVLAKADLVRRNLVLLKEYHDLQWYEAEKVEDIRSEAALSRGRALIRQNKIAEALKAIQEGLPDLIKGENVNHWHVMLRVLRVNTYATKTIPKELKLTPQQLIDEAEETVKLAKGLKTKKKVPLSYTIAESLWMAAFALVSGGEKKKAESYLREAIDLDSPYQGQIQMSLAQLLGMESSLNKRKEILEHVQKAVDAAFQHPGSLEQIAKQIDNMIMNADKDLKKELEKMKEKLEIARDLPPSFTGLLLPILPFEFKTLYLIIWRENLVFNKDTENADDRDIAEEIGFSALLSRADLGQGGLSCGKTGNLGYQAFS